MATTEYIFSKEGMGFSRRHSQWLDERRKNGQVRKPTKEDLKPGAFVRGGRQEAIYRVVYEVNALNVWYGWWIPHSDSELEFPPGDAEFLGGLCSIKSFLSWCCDLMREAP